MNIREAIEQHSPDDGSINWYVDEHVIDCDAEEFWKVAEEAGTASASSQIPLTLAEQVRDIAPAGSKKIHFPVALSNDDIGTALTAALMTFPDAPVIIIDTPDGSVYYMNTREK